MSFGVFSIKKIRFGTIIELGAGFSRDMIIEDKNGVIWKLDLFSDNRDCLIPD